MNSKIHVAISLFLLSYLPALQAAPDTEGQWSEQAEWPMIPIHAVLTPEGKILTWGVEGIDSAEFVYDVWDPESGLAVSSHNTVLSNIGISSFCSSGLVLPETGNVLLPGGEGQPGSLQSSGVASVAEFNISNNSVSPAAEMSFARWYPTSITLPNGEILVLGGRDEQLREVITPEVYSPETNEWRSLLGVQTTDYGYFYPKLWVLPDGRVFGMQYQRMFYVDTNGQGSLSIASLLPEVGQGGSTAVMYRPGKIMRISEKEVNATSGALLVDVTGETPTVRETTKLTQEGRLWANSVVLPNGKVMVIGGSAVSNEAEGASYQPEIWDPATEQWSLMSQSQRMRLYHSTAILLKDGRILVSGGGAPGPVSNKNAEVFTPPYLFDADGLAARPTITLAPTESPYGASVSINHPSDDAIARVTLVKTGAVTHAFNMEQRFIELDFADTSDGVRVEMPVSPNIATPGHYLMYLINDKGVPSNGHIIRISETAVYNETPIDNPDPVALADSATAESNNPVTIDVLINDEGEGLTISDFDSISEAGGTITVSDNELIYTSAETYVGQDTFSYEITDASERTVSAVVTVEVTEVVNNPEPVANPDTATADSDPIVDDPENEIGNTIIIDALDNDTGDGLVLLEPNAWSLEGGTVSIVDNEISYTPKIGYNGEDKIWYTINDAEGRSSWSVITIDVTGSGILNPEPVSEPDTASTADGATITIDVLSNDIGNGLTIIEPSAWSLHGGSVALVDNELSYTPKPGYDGEDKIWYDFTDIEGRGSWGEVTIEVTGSGVFNPSPASEPDTATAVGEDTITIDVLSNDIGNGLTLIEPNLWSLEGGNVALVDNKLSYTPKLGYEGEDKIWYDFTDIEGRSNWGVVTIEVTP